MSLTGVPDGEPGGGPMKVGVAVADLFSGMYTASAILAALYRREQTGEGATIDLALFDTQLAMLANQASNALVSGKDPRRQGAGHPNIVPYQPFQAADQPIIIAVGNDRQFAKLAAILGHPEWASDPAFATNAARVAARETLVPMIAEIIAAKPAAEWLEQLEAGGHSGRADQHDQPGAGRPAGDPSRRPAYGRRRRAWRSADGRQPVPARWRAQRTRRCRRRRSASMAICCSEWLGSKRPKSLERLRDAGTSSAELSSASSSL